MNKTKRNRRKKIFANNLHKQTLLLIFIAALLPTVFTAISLFYLIFGIMSIELCLPEVIAYTIVPAAKKVTAILFIAAPITIVAILLFAHKITLTIIGPFERIIRELDDHIKGKKEGHIPVRKTDKFRPLVDRINALLDKIKQS